MPTPHGLVERLAELSQSGVPFVCVTMVDAIGSTPQDPGSKMLVTAGGIDCGTVGGGRVEHKCIEHARDMLRRPVNQSPRIEFVGPDPMVMIGSRAASVAVSSVPSFWVM